MSFAFDIGYRFWGTNRNDIEFQVYGAASSSVWADILNKLFRNGV